MSPKLSTTEKGNTFANTSAQQVEKMYRMIIDFSGQQGLVDRYYGDYPFDVSNPQLSMNGGASQYASGTVNPLSIYGYLSPANGTFNQVESYTAATNIITATEIDEENGIAIFGDAQGYVNKTASLTAAALDATVGDVQLGSDTYVTDLAFYSVGGTRKLFFAYTNTSTGNNDVGVWDLTGNTSTTVNGTRVFYGYTDNTYSVSNCSWSINTNTITIPGSPGTSVLRVGMSVTSAAGIPPGAIIQSINSSTQISVNQILTANESNVTITFLPCVQAGTTITGETSGATGLVLLDLNNTTLVSSTLTPWAAPALSQWVVYTEPNSQGNFVAFSLGETVTGTTSGATGTITAYPQSVTNSPGTWYVTAASAGVGGFFAVGETINGGTSGASGIITSQLYSPVKAGTWLIEVLSGSFSNGETVKTSNTHITAEIGYTGGPVSSIVKNFMSNYVQRVDSTGIVSSTQGNNFLGQSNAQIANYGNPRLVVADNGLMYILDGAFIHYYDGTILGSAETPTTAGTQSGFGSLYWGVVEFPPNYQLVDAIDHRGSLWVTLLYSTRNILSVNSNVYNNYCGVYIWNRQPASQPSDFIIVDGVREIRAITTFQGVPTLFTISNNNYTQIRMWNGSQFKVVQQLGQLAYPQFHDSVSSNGDSLTWLGYDGKVYYFGSENPAQKSALWVIGDTTTQVSNGSNFNYGGAILLSGGNVSSSAGYQQNPEAYYLSISDNSPKMQILQWYPHMKITTGGNTQFADPGNYFTLVKPFPKLAQTHWLTLYYPPVGSANGNTLLSVNIYVNQSTTPWNASPIVLTGNDGIRGYKTIPMNITGVNQIQVEVIYPTNIALFLIPTISYASVDYNQTSKVL